ncbi:RHS repeat-associated core domain-containing protein [Chryseobacterium endophyticum]|uniref:RHS repeat-associated core domain-containing protein n=1 Tax=Chryseobacterium endophyticum TaxID=1854762 RepID=A0AAU6WVL5_9FLAO
MVEQQEPTAYVNPYKFNAKELDDETGLYYYGVRYYNPRDKYLVQDRSTGRLQSSN